jgi:hypothetical protein
MPAKSKAQYRFMKAVESGAAKAPGLSKKEAKEYVAGQSPKGLPEKKNRFDKLKKALKK